MRAPEYSGTPLFKPDHLTLLGYLNVLATPFSSTLNALVFLKSLAHYS